ncbi:MAG: BON domain-containing protein [Planctomycetaceae bacterium]
MPIKSKWILTLGILAMSPSLAMAKNPFSLPSLTKSPAASSASTAKSNQDVANEIAAALRQARLVGYDINIEFKDGTATLTGMIQDSHQKALAEKMTLTVADVTKVDNRLGLITPDQAQPVQQTAFEAPVRSSTVEQAGFEASASQPIASPIQQTGGQQQASSKAQNQQVANNIARTLQESGLAGYDVEISYKNGVALLGGTVGTPEQAQRIAQITSQVQGVKSVDNQLRYSAGPVAQTAFQPELPPPGPMGNGYETMPAPGVQGGYPPGMGMPPGDPPVQMHGGPVDGHGGPGPVNPVYTQPYLPEHAWPTYAAYPNSAAVNYPTQYSASAFPYIGPFYPYPQVPLGWRSSTLEWDDGQWQLKFSPKTDRWWWFFNPKNWN